MNATIPIRLIHVILMQAVRIRKDPTTALAIGDMMAMGSIALVRFRFYTLPFCFPLRRNVSWNHVTVIFFLDIDECNEGTHKCQTDATCDNTIGWYNCTCNPGFDGNGLNCAGSLLNTSQISWDSPKVDYRSWNGRKEKYSSLCTTLLLRRQKIFYERLLKDVVWLHTPFYCIPAVSVNISTCLF